MKKLLKLIIPVVIIIAIIVLGTKYISKPQPTNSGDTIPASGSENLINGNDNAADLMKSYEPKDILDDGVDTVEAYFEVTNNADTKLNIRSLPNTNSDVIGQIEGDGDVVWVNSKTVATEKIGDSEKSWYNISYETDEDVITGWVFGAYLK